MPANTAVQVAVQMNADASKMQHTANPTVSPVQAAPAPLTGLGNLSRHLLTEAGSYLTFGQGGSTKLRLPVYSAPVPASAMAGTVPVATGGATLGATTVQLTGVDTEAIAPGPAARAKCRAE